MQGNAKPLIQFLDGSEKRFIIPVYQRNYDWKITNCKQLFDDLVKVVKKNKNTHFFGSIVSSPNGTGMMDCLIIDGQQRITTISLLFSAMVNAMKNGLVTSNDWKLCEKIEKKFLVDEFQMETRKVRLKPIKDDQEAFDKIINGIEEEYIRSSNVTQNYNYFFDRIKFQEITVDELYQAICKLQIIDIFLQENDDPQLIFESLNSTGVDLSEGDKIRNFVLMGLEPKIQEQYYNEYWNKIEKNTDYNVSNFIRDYLTVKQSKITTFSLIYVSFKEYVLSSNIETGTILADLLEYSKIYKIILNSNSKSKLVNEVLSRLNMLDMSVTYPFLLEFFRTQEYQLTEIQFVEVLKCIESYIFRRLICGIPTNSLNKTFATLHKDVYKLVGQDSTYSEVAKHILISKTSSGVFPRDEEFVDSFQSKNVYSMNTKNKIYLFNRFENKDNVEKVNVVQMMNDYILTVEHIMPQKLSLIWQRELGNEYHRIHNEWLNTIANLTLTGYNSKYSNHPFCEKRDMKYGYKESGLRLNKYVAEQNTWTEKELKDRSEIIKKLSLELWSYPETTFIPVAPISDIVSLDDDYNFTGKYIKTFTYKDIRYEVQSWREMFTELLKLIYTEESSLLHRMADDKKIVDIKNETILLYGYEIAEGINVDISNSTKSKIAVLRNVFEYCNLDMSDLQMEISRSIEDSDIEIVK
ncbi:MAG: DUF262 domain-containing protein [Fermentimonas sp.]|nr:DUF262 domain-containing protein [Fermentimonas sp.]